MTLRKTVQNLVVLASVVSACAIDPMSAQAGTLHNGWNYSIDSFDDSIAGNAVGGTKYEIFGTAIQQTDERVTFAINANLPLEGVAGTSAYVDWGDLFFNFSGTNLDTASANASLIAINFAASNESSASETGVYINATAKSVASANGLLLNSLGDYNNWVSQNGSTPRIGDLRASHPYFNSTRNVQNVMSSGTKVGDITFVDDVSALGLDFGHFGASGLHNIVFHVERSLLPDGSYVYHLGPECDNDVTAGIGTLAAAPPTDVPEPSVGLAMLAMGSMMVSLRRRQR